MTTYILVFMHVHYINSAPLLIMIRKRAVQARLVFCFALIQYYFPAYIYSFFAAVIINFPVDDGVLAGGEIAEGVV